MRRGLIRDKGARVSSIKGGQCRGLRPRPTTPTDKNSYRKDVAPHNLHKMFRLVDKLASCSTFRIDIIMHVYC